MRLAYLFLDALCEPWTPRALLAVGVLSAAWLIARRRWSW